MAPELIEGRRNTTRSDIYALGIILYIFYYGYPPFNHEDISILLKMHQTSEIIFSDKNNESVSIQIKDIITKSLQKNPNYRFRNINQMIRNIMRYQKNTNFNIFNNIIFRKLQFNTKHDDETKKQINKRL
jgi:serine/threonine protein kinase